MTGPDRPRPAAPPDHPRPAAPPDRTRPAAPPDHPPPAVPPELVAAVTAAGPAPVWWRIGLFGALGVGAALLVVTEIRHARGVLTVLVLAGVLAVALDPLVRVLVRRGWRRGSACAVVLVGVLGTLIAFCAAVVPAVAGETSKLSAQLPNDVERVQRQQSWIGSQLRRYDVAGRLHHRGSGKPASAAQTLHSALGIGRTALSVAGVALTLIAVTCYLLADLPRVKRSAYRLVSRSRRPRVTLIADAALDRVAGYMLGNIVTSLIAAVGTVVVLLPLHVPYPLALAALVFVADLVPVIGSTVGGAAVTLLALTVSVTAGVICLAYYVLYRQAEDYLLIPRIMRRTVDVAPIISITAVLLGAAVDGIVGALLAVPVAAALKIVVTEVVWPAQDGR